MSVRGTEPSGLASDPIRFPWRSRGFPDLVPAPPPAGPRARARGRKFAPGFMERHLGLGMRYVAGIYTTVISMNGAFHFAVR